MTIARYTLPVPPDTTADVQAARLWAAGATGVWLRPGEVVGYFPERTPAVPTGGVWADEPGQDWLARWRDGLEPVAAGPFDVVPTWLVDDHPAVAHRHRIVLDPGRAFGSGHHDTTAGCLEALGELDLALRTVLDVGTGTGVLAIAAALAGAQRVVAVDVDPAAIEVAADNAAANGVTLQLAVGSVDARPGPHDVVVANLLTGTVLELADALVGAVAPGGILVASGIGAQRGDAVALRLREAGLVDVEVRTRGEWAVLVGRSTGRRVGAKS